MPPKERYIAHVDMDAFFASVEERDTPAYKNKPIVVGADPANGKGRGVVSACSYKARKFGIHSAMPISIAYRKCPAAIFLPVDMEKYANVSREIFTILEKFTPDIEPISIDEAFMDITGSYHHFGSPSETCRKIKFAIKKETGLTSSIGLAPNKMTAKIASDLNKPDGIVVVNQKNLLSFLHPLPIEKLWGIGRKTEETFKSIGIITIGDLARRDLREICASFGKNGEHAWRLANGIDPRQVEASDTVKSISNEYTFGEDTSESHKIKDVLMQLSEKISYRLRRSKLKGRTITLRIRFSDFKTYTRSITIDRPTNFADVIYKHSVEKVADFDLSNKRVRLLGVRVSNLLDSSQTLDLFDEDSTQMGKSERIHKALDKILNKFGEGALKRRRV